MAGTLKMRKIPVLAARYSDQKEWMMRFRKHALSLGGGSNGWLDREGIKHFAWVRAKMQARESPESVANEFMSKFYPADWVREFERNW